MPEEQVEGDWDHPNLCCVCYEKSTHLTKCRHILCLGCMAQLLTGVCPVCRANLGISSNRILVTDPIPDVTTWRRLRVIQFESTFVDPHPVPNIPPLEDITDPDMPPLEDTRPLSQQFDPMPSVPDDN
jgi:hypothetical protein